MLTLVSTREVSELAFESCTMVSLYHSKLSWLQCARVSRHKSCLVVSRLARALKTKLYAGNQSLVWPGPKDYRVAAVEGILREIKIIVGSIFFWKFLGMLQHLWTNYPPFSAIEFDVYTHTRTYAYIHTTHTHTHTHTTHTHTPHTHTHHTHYIHFKKH